MGLHFRSQNGCDNSTFGGRIDSLNSALLISKRLYSGAKMALYFRSRNSPYNSTFRGGIDFLSSDLSMSKRRHRRAKNGPLSQELKWLLISVLFGADIPLNESQFNFFLFQNSPDIFQNSPT